MRFRTIPAGLALPADADARVRQFLDYWRSKCVAGGIARRRDIDPLEIVRLLPIIVLIDVDGADFRFSLVGEEITERYGPLRGRCLRDVMSGRELRETLDEHRLCIESKLPVFSFNTERSARPGDWQLYQRLLTPLAGADGTATSLAGIMVFQAYGDRGGRR